MYQDDPMQAGEALILACNKKTEPEKGPLDYWPVMLSQGA